MGIQSLHGALRTIRGSRIHIHFAKVAEIGYLGHRMVRSLRVQLSTDVAGGNFFVGRAGNDVSALDVIGVRFVHPVFFK